ETTRTVTANNTLGNLPTANRSNSITKGWYTAATGGTEVTSDTVITGNVTYYAQYYSTMDQANITPIRVAMKIGDERTITITGPEDMESYTITSNDTDVATVSGNTVTAVGMGETTLTVTGNESGITKTIEVEVISATRYKVTFNANGGTISETTRYVYEGQPIGVLPTGTKDEDVVVGWYKGLVDGIKIDKNYIVDSDLILYPKWGEATAEFDEGLTVNVKMKKLANPEANITSYSYADSNITSITKYVGTPDISLMTEDNIISSDDSLLPIYAWFDNGTLYWWTDTNNVYLNEDSSYMFAYINNCNTLDLSIFNSDNLTNTKGMFYGSTYDELDISSLNTSNVTDMSYMFCVTTVPSLDLSNNDFSKVEDMSYMFTGSHIQTVDFGDIETDSLVDMNNMFNSAAFTELDLSKFDTHNVTNMSNLFVGSNLKSIDLSDLDTENLTNIAQMFAGCINLESIDLSDLDTHNVTNMNSLFAGNSNLKTIDMSNWDFSGMTSLSGFFSHGLPQLEEIILDNVNTSTITDMYGMFKDCPSLTTLDLSDLDTENVTNMVVMFSGCSSLTELDLSSFNTSNVTSFGGFLSGCTSLETLNMSNFDLRKNTSLPLLASMGVPTDASLKTVILDNAIFGKDMFNTFHNYSTIETISLKNVDTSLTTSMNWMFQGCTNLKSLDLSSFNTSNVTNLYYMFGDCSSLTELDLSMFDTRNVIGFGGFISGCTSLETLNMSNFNFTNNLPSGLFSNLGISTTPSLKTIIFDNSVFGKNMIAYFSDAGSVETISLKNVDTSSVTSMISLFENSPNLTELDLSDFDTRNVENMSNMFKNCSGLTTVYVSDDFVVNQVTSSGDMFLGCESVVGGLGTTYDANHIDKEYAHYDGGELYPGYFTATDISSKFEITFKDNNKILFKRYITKGNRVGSLPVVTKEGYDFVGWYSSNVDGIEITEEYVPQDNINIYARYIKKVTVSFDIDGGSEVPSQTINYGSTATRPATNPIKELYKFDDWYTDDTYTTKFDFTTPITSDTIIYAKFIDLCKGFSTDSWSTIKTNLENNSEYYAVGCTKEVPMDMDNDGTDESYTVRLANTSTPEVCEVEGYSQTGCGIVIEFSDIVGSGSMNSKNSNAGGWASTNMVIYLNSTFYNKLPSDLQNVIIRTYPIVSGSGSGGVSPNITADDKTKNKIYLLSLREVGLDLSYDNKRNVLTDTRTLDYYVDPVVTDVDLADSRRIKKDLSGVAGTWWLRTAYSALPSNFLVIYDTGGFSQPSAEHVYGVSPAFRIGTISEFTVKFNTDGGSIVSDQIVNYGGLAIKPLLNPTKDGYVFDDWYTDDTYTTKFDFTTLITSDTTIYAKWVKSIDDATITPSSVTMDLDETSTITVTGPEDMEPYTISSEDETIVTVDSNGVLTGISGGTTTIKITGNVSGITKEVEVTVNVPTIYNVNYNANGGSFNGETSNSITYTVYKQNKTEYSHTSNISNDGVQNGSYVNNLATKEVVTIPGASSVHVKLTYGTEASYDYVYVFKGQYSGNVSKNMSAGQLYTYNGSNNTTTTVEFDVEGDTVTFAFYSDSSSTYYGYYAVVSADSKYSQDAEYTVPTRTNKSFTGWNTAQDGSGTTYYTEEEIMNDFEELNGQTLYAQWSYVLTYDFNEVNDVQSWKFIGENQFNITYDSSTGMNDITVNGLSGTWENIYIPVRTEVGETYKFEVDYYNPNGYNGYSSYEGIGMMALKSEPTNSSSISSITSSYLPRQANPDIQHRTITFKATGTTTYLSFIFAYAADGETTNVKLGNFKITKDLTSRYTITTVPNILFEEGINFGFYTAKENGTLLEDDTEINDDVTYYGLVTRNRYKIRFDSNDGEGSIPDLDMIYGIKATLPENTFTRFDYGFVGWNTEPDGTGNSYSDEAIVNKLSNVNNDIVTLYAQWLPAESTFDTGSNVNSKLTSLAGSKENITSIVKSNTAPIKANRNSSNVVSTATSNVPIYAWYEEGTIYWWTQDDDPELNANASSMFSGFTSVTSIDLNTIISPNTTTMASMFNGCSGLSELDLSNFRGDSLTNTSYMFQSCSSLTEIDLTNF
ncbi:MAG: BspA family leucine-rich repeat surface protein, partial [Methanosphaera sp.]|nr:BspA family leucine-rich repeat surface protein [Methanosphaera sp.]